MRLLHWGANLSHILVRSLWRLRLYGITVGNVAIGIVIAERQKRNAGGRDGVR